MIEPRGLVGATLHDQLAELVDGAITVRTAQPVYHVHLDPLPGVWSEDVRAAFWARFEAEFELSGARYCGAVHMKAGRIHEHRCYDLTLDDGAVTSLSWDRLRREKIAVLVAHEFGLPLPPIKHIRAVARRLEQDGRHEVAAALLGESATPTRIAFRTPQERAQEDRRRTSKADVGHAVLAAWKGSDGGTAFEAALAAVGLTLAKGREVPVIIDTAGAAWPVARLLGQASKGKGETRIKAAEVHRRLANLALPTPEEVCRERPQPNASQARAGGSPAATDESWSREADHERDNGHAPGRNRDADDGQCDPGSAHARGGRIQPDPRSVGEPGSNSAPPTSDAGRDGEVAARYQRAPRADRAKAALIRAALHPKAHRIATLIRQLLLPPGDADNLVNPTPRRFQRGQRPTYRPR